jgi:ankyrin repeat protein
LLYRHFLESLPLEPAPIDDNQARGGRFASELMLWKNHAAGPWNYWLHSYLGDGYDVNVRDFDGKTPLHHAVATKFEKESKVKALLEAGADVTILDSNHQTPVEIARGDTGLFMRLLRAWQKSL